MLFLAGVEKAGTTELFDVLGQRGLVSPGRVKELRVFDVPCDDDVGGSAGAAAAAIARRVWWRHAFHWSHTQLDVNDTAVLLPSKSLYLSLFPAAAAQPHACYAEATPSYVFDPCAVPRVLLWFPAAKAVVLLRHPVHRLLSFWRMMEGDGGRSLAAFVASERAVLGQQGLHQLLTRTLTTASVEEADRAWAIAVRTAQRRLWDSGGGSTGGGGTGAVIAVL